MGKLRGCYDQDKIFVGYMFYCPACESYHHVWDKTCQHNKPFAWDFNGNWNNPTFCPSIMINKDNFDEKNPKCHFFIDWGKIRYESDCSHKYAGQTIEMEEI